MKRSQLSAEFSEEDRDVPLYFGKKKKSAEENGCCYFVAITAYFKDIENPKRSKSFKKYHQRMKDIIVGNHKHIPTAIALPQLSKSKYFINGLLRMIVNAHKLSLEEKKDVIIMVHDVLKYDQAGKHPAVDIFATEKLNGISPLLFEEINSQMMCSFCGNILRIFSKYEKLLQYLLNMDNLKKLVQLVKDQRFELSSEAFETLKHLLAHKKLEEKNFVKNFMLTNYEKFFEQYTSMIKYDSNYLAQRTSIRTLYELLEDPTFEEVTIKFISDIENLKTVVELLKAQERQGLQYEAFLLLEVIIEHLNKSSNPEIKELISKNKSKLLDFLRQFEYTESEEEYKEKKEMMIHKLDILQ